MVHLPDGRPSQGELLLELKSPEQRVIVQGNQLRVQFHKRGSAMLPLLLIVLGALSLGFVVIRRRTGAQATPIAQAPRRLS